MFPITILVGISRAYIEKRRLKPNSILAPFVASFSPETSIKDYLLSLINASSFFGRIL